MTNNNICCIFNLAPHYNGAIYHLMEAELKCDFYIGDKLSYPILTMDYNTLKGFKKILNNEKIIKEFYWQKGAVSLVFKSYQYFIITGEPYCVSTWLILILNRLLNKKSLLWTHGWYGDESFPKKFIKKIFFKLSNTVLLYGDYAKDLMIKEGFNAEKLIPVYNSMDYFEQLKVRNKLKNNNIYEDYFKNKLPVLLYIGRITLRKKIDLLIKALKQLHEQGNKCNLILIGKEAEKVEFKQLIEKYNLEKYIWEFGACYDESVLGNLIYNADLCIVPGDIGLTAMHALVYGTPVITHNNFAKQGPEFEAIIPSINGDFFKENSVDDLCDKIKEWITQNTNRREVTRENCYKIINEKYNPRIQIEILKSVILN